MKNRILHYKYGVFLALAILMVVAFLPVPASALPYPVHSDVTVTPEAYTEDVYDTATITLHMKSTSIADGHTKYTLVLPKGVTYRNTIQGNAPDRTFTNPTTGEVTLTWEVWVFFGEYDKTHIINVEYSKTGRYTITAENYVEESASGVFYFSDDQCVVTVQQGS